MRISSNRFMRLVAHCGTCMGGVGGTKPLIVQKGNTIAMRADLDILSRAATRVALSQPDISFTWGQMEIQLTGTVVGPHSAANLPYRWTRVTAPRARHQQ